MCCHPWCRKESDTTEQLNWTELLYNVGVGFAIHWHASANHGYTCVPPSWTSSCSSISFCFMRFSPLLLFICILRVVMSLWRTDPLIINALTYTWYGEGNGNPLQSSCLENPMDGGAWWAAVHGVAGSQTRLSDFTFMHWRRKWQSTMVFLPEESQGWQSLVDCRLWGRTESNTTEAT